MSILSFCCFILFLIYLAIIGFLLDGWKKVAVFQAPANFSPKVRISVIVPVRNEADHLAECIKSLMAQDYPHDLYEVLIVDDQSYDETPDIARQWEDSRLSYMRLGVEGRTTIEGSKKKAIAYGASHATGELMVTTDGDCILPPAWLRTVAACYQHQPDKLIAGAVIPVKAEGLFAAFVSLDMMNTFAIQCAGIATGRYFLCSGANLACERKAFLQSEPYASNMHIASGDDIFLIDKFRRQFPGRIAVLKSPEAVCETIPPSDMASFLSQRLRWSGKMKKTTGSGSLLLASLIWLQRVAPWVLLAVGLFNGDRTALTHAAIIIVMTWVADFVMLYRTAQFFGRKRALYWFLPSEFMFTLYFTVAGLLSWLPLSLEWKGRRLRI